MIACIRKEEVHEDFLNIPAVVRKKKKSKLQKKSDSEEESPSMSNLFNKVSSWSWHGN